MGAGCGGGGGEPAVRVVYEVLGGEEAGCDEAPGAVPAVDGDSVQGVVKVKLEGDLRSTEGLQIMNVAACAPQAAIQIAACR